MSEKEKLDDWRHTKVNWQPKRSQRNRPKHNKKPYLYLNKQISEKCRQNKNEFINKQCFEIQKYTNKHEIGDLFRKIKEVTKPTNVTNLWQMESYAKNFKLRMPTV